MLIGRKAKMTILGSSKKLYPVSQEEGCYNYSEGNTVITKVQGIN